MENSSGGSDVLTLGLGLFCLIERCNHYVLGDETDTHAACFLAHKPAFFFADVHFVGAGRHSCALEIK